MMRRLLLLLLTSACLLPISAFARETIEASPYGIVLEDLLGAFHAVDVPCEGVPTGLAEACFRSDAVGASYLAERLTEIVADHASTGLSTGAWRSANGVWTVTLSFPNESYGHLEVYLAEAQDNCVNGMVRLVTGR